MKKIILFYLLLLLSTIVAEAQDFDSSISAAAENLSKKIVISQRKTVAVVNFINIDETVTQLGKFVSEELSSELSNLTDNQTKFRVLERSKLDEILKEKKLIQSSDGSKLAMELGKLDIAQILIFASITDYEGYYRVTIKLLDTKNGDALGSQKVNFVKTPSLMSLNDKVIVGNSKNETATHTININAPKKESPPLPVAELGDYCFKNRGGSLLRPDVKVSIYGKNNATQVKVLDVSSGQTSCLYEIPKGVYRIELVWHSGSATYKRETKEVRIETGKSNTIELEYNN